jgi:hypothetical protein
VYSYSLTKPSLGRLYRICRPEVIFRGETLLLPGMPGLDVESVETSSVARAALFMALHPGFFLGRLFGRRRGRKRQHADPIEAGD